MTVHLSVPLRLNRHGGFVTVDIDSAEEITESVRAALLTEPGTRLTDPEFGVPGVAFRRDFDDLADQIVEMEPRATPVEVEAAVDQAGAATIDVTSGGDL